MNRPDEADRPPAARNGVTPGVEQFIRTTLRQIRRLAIAIVGLTVVLVGLIMIVTPGPALIVAPFGLAILALEFAWARRLLRRVREHAARLARSRRTPPK